MERLKLQAIKTAKTLDSLEQVLQQDFSEFIRDATIQRFEYTIDTLWKFLKQYLFDIEGIEEASPKKVIRQCFNINLINEIECKIILDLINDRNNTSHIYSNEVADQVYLNIKENFNVLKDVLERLEKSIN